MILLKEIDNKLEEIYKRFKKDSGDKTGWSFLWNLKKQANFHPFLFSFLVYRAFEIAYKKGEIINAPKVWEEFLNCNYYQEYYHPTGGSHLPEKDKKEIFPKIFFFKGLLTKILEELDLKETLTTFYYSLIIKEEEINERNYLTKEQIKKFTSKDAREIISDIFWREYKKKKLDKKPRIIKIRK